MQALLTEYFHQILRKRTSIYASHPVLFSVLLENCGDPLLLAGLEATVPQIELGQYMGHSLPSYQTDQKQ